MPGPKNTDPRQRIFFFGQGASDGDPARKDILGGKGASLAAMSRAGLSTPPGFTISAECCREYLESDGHWPAGLEDELRANLTRLEQATGKTFGEGRQPLLVSVRSGAAVSMPGMMDTLLNCGLYPGLATQLPNPAQFWQAYAQFVQFFGKTVGEITEPQFEAAAAQLNGDATSGERLAAVYQQLYQQHTQRQFPDTPWKILLACVNAVFDSWNSERAIVYRKAHDIRGLFGTAVTVQSMFPSEVSGIAFTANPANPAADEIVIESSYGLGEAIVSGLVTPDRFTLDRTTLAIKDRSLGHKQHSVAALGDTSSHATRDADGASLTDAEVAQVAKLAMDVERYFGYAVDIEWGLAAGQMVLLQSRAIRGLDIAADVEVGRREQIARLGELAAGQRKVWVAHNLGETLPTPTPLTWDVIRHFMSGDGGFGHMYRDFGYRPSSTVCRDGFLELIAGKIYLDADRAAELFWGNMPLVYDLEKILVDPTTVEMAPTKFEAARADGTFLVRLPGMLLAMLRSSRRMKKARAKTIEVFQRDILPPYLEYVKSEQSRDLKQLTTAQVIEQLHARSVRVLDQFGKESLKPGFFGGMARGALQESLTQLFGEAQGQELCLTLTSGISGDSTIEQNILLYRVAHGEVTLADFVKQYGHRAVSEMELAEPRWREDTAYLEQMLENYRGAGVRAPEALHAAKTEKRLAAEAALPAQLVEFGGSSFREEIFDLLRETQALLPYREIGKHYLMLGYELVRAPIVELARRWDLGRDAFFLHLDELPQFETQQAALTERIAQRKIRWQSARRLDHPLLIDSGDLERLGLPRELASAQQYKAVSLASGIVEGTARVVEDPKSAGELEKDCILICTSTDPGWTALFINIKGLIVERGGVLSHGAITARDFGLPAVACPDATRLIASGTRVRVDGDRGQITILDGPPQAGVAGKEPVLEGSSHA